MHNFHILDIYILHVNYINEILITYIKNVKFNPHLLLAVPQSPLRNAWGWLKAEFYSQSSIFLILCQYCLWELILSSVCQELTLAKILLGNLQCIISQKQTKEAEKCNKGFPSFSTSFPINSESNRILPCVHLNCLKSWQNWFGVCLWAGGKYLNTVLKIKSGLNESVKYIAGFS